MMYKIGIRIIIVLMSLNVVSAQDRIGFSLGADLVSSYVWRGMYCSGTSIQPAMELQVAGFSAGVWSSVDIASIGFKEIDLYAAYSLGRFTLLVTDFWIGKEGDYHYFDFKKNETSHTLEGTLSYRFPFPLSISWSTMFAGKDTYVESGDTHRAYSTYIEAGYSFSVKNVGLDAALGASPWNSRTLYTAGYPYATDGFAVVNVSLKATREIKLTDSYSTAISGQLIFNPAKEDTFLVLALSF